MIKKILLFQCTILLLSLPVPAFEESDIDFLENSLYHKLYSEESLGERLNRLENDMLGMGQAGSIDERVEKLLTLNENRFNVATPNFTETEHSPEKKEGKIKKFFNGVSDMFSSGTITGFTPPLGSSYYSNGYSSYGNYNNRYFNNYTNPSAPGLFDALPSYCQYYGRRKNYGYNHPINSTYYNPRFHSPHNYRHTYHPNGFYGNGYNNFPTYTMPNIITNSGVHILKD